MTLDERPTRVVLVDDSDDLRMMLRMRLGLLSGVEVVGEGRDGIEGLEAVRTHRPDVAVLDLGMPRMDGLEAATILRDELPGVLLIALTGFKREALEGQAREAGFTHYLVKGADMSELETLLLGKAAA